MPAESGSFFSIQYIERNKVSAMHYKQLTGTKDRIPRARVRLKRGIY